MTLKQQCNDTIYAYADAEAQMNANLFGEHQEYIKLVISLVRADYHRHTRAGLTEFNLDDNIVNILQDECPW